MILINSLRIATGSRFTTNASLSSNSSFTSETRKSKRRKFNLRFTTSGTCSKPEDTAPIQTNPESSLDSSKPTSNVQQHISEISTLSPIRSTKSPFHPLSILTPPPEINLQATIFMQSLEMADLIVHEPSVDPLNDNIVEDTHV